MAKLSGLLSSLLSEPDIAAVLDAARDTRDPSVPALRIEGPSALRPFLAAGMADPAGADRTVLAVTATDREAADLGAAAADLLGPDAVEVLPSWETLPHERLSPRPDTVGRRLSIFRRLADPAVAPRVVVTAARSLIQPIAPGLGSLDPVELRVGDSADFDDLLERLVELAYVRVEMVTARGEFAVRGGIVDIFPPTAEHPVRVEFWGDEVSELRSFAVADQRSLGPVDELLAPGCRELLLTEPVRSRAAALARTYENNPALRELLEHLAEGIPTEGMESLVPVLAGGELELLTDLLPAGALVLLADPERIRTRSADLVRTGQEFLAASWFAAGMGGASPIDVGASAYRDLTEVLEHAAGTGRPVLTLSPLISGRDDALAPAVREVESYRGDTDRALVDLRAHVATGGTAVLVVGGHGTAQRSLEQLREADVPAELVDRLTEAPTAGPGHRDLRAADRRVHHRPAGGAQRGGPDREPGRRRGPQAGQPPAQRRRPGHPQARRPRRALPARHRPVRRDARAHGRRRHPRVPGAGVRQLQARAATRTGCSCPTDALDEISRYVGGEVPTLNKLGGADWAKTKGRARKAVRQIAAQLVQLYAARQAAPGHAFGADTPWQAELEDAFPFTETPDQLVAINEVKADMERPVPMDRVISGDVGFGKTEIAVRAAFKAVQDGKQVAVLVPTTLLATQHLATFSERMRAFPVTVRGLSRFTDPAEARETIEGLADGSVDVVIGTHRLLQKGVRWKDLGLVIVDEEQRFGVEHKEHITALRTHVDVLTLSATPIPRTLEMSLAGIREMSTITTPPEDRHPTLTYVGAYDDKQVAAAIRRELLRDGQVFYVHNRVSTHRPGGGHDPPAGPGGPGRGGARPDERGPAGADRGRLLGGRVRRAGLHDDRGERPGHLQRQHADRRALRHARAVPAAPAARPGRPRPGARLRLLPVPARAPAHRDRARPAGHHRPALRAGRGHRGGHEGPGDPRRRQHPGRRAERAHRRRRVRPLHPAGRRGGGRVPPAGRRGRGRGGGDAGRGAGGPAGRRAHPARLRDRRAAPAGDLPQDRRGGRPGARWTRSSTSSPTATASRRSRCATCSRWPRSGRPAGRSGSPR